MAAIDSPPLTPLRDALLGLLAQGIALDRGEVRSQLTKLGLDKVVAMAERAITHKSDRFAEPDADASRVEASWEHAVALNEFHVDLRRALKEAEKAYERTPTEGTLAAILEIQQRLALGKGTEAEGAGDA